MAELTVFLVDLLRYLVQVCHEIFFSWRIRIELLLQDLIQFGLFDRLVEDKVDAVPILLTLSIFLHDFKTEAEDVLIGLEVGILPKYRQAVNIRPPGSAGLLLHRARFLILLDLV